VAITSTAKDDITKPTSGRISSETKREVDRLLVRELRENLEHHVGEMISLRSAISLKIPMERDFIISAFSDALFNSRSLLEKAQRIEDRLKRSR
jgi:hypothetical protein